MAWLLAVLDSTGVENDHTFCKWIIGGLAGFIVLAGGGGITWIKSLIDKNDKLQEARIVDLKENYRQLKHRDD